MGIVYADIILRNVGDILKFKEKLINKNEIRQRTITAMVDTGAGTLVINEEIQKQLGLGVQGQRSVVFGKQLKRGF